ncbi:hypothetical protein BGZ83_006928 [Gryganskiella cystojenkinii]|nr:hypothetical protein BGZ83_006928 [Gryganskiella cystojenkinii]
MSNSQPTSSPPSHISPSLPSRITAFEIPFLLDLICSHFYSRKELGPCLQVSRLWHHLFLPQILRFVRFADLNVAQTWDVVDHAHCIRDLEIDLKDAGIFLSQELSMDNNNRGNSDDHDNRMPSWRPSCKNLETLTCSDFRYFDPLEDAFGSYLRVPADPRANALGLLALNPRLHTLRILHGCGYPYFFQPFTPSCWQVLATHAALTRLILQPEQTRIDSEFLRTLLTHLPPKLQDLEINVESFWFALERQEPEDEPGWWNPNVVVPVPDEEIQGQQSHQYHYQEELLVSQRRPLVKDLEPNSLKRLVILHSEEREWTDFPPLIYEFLEKCPQLIELSLSLLAGGLDRGQFLRSLKVARPPVKILNLGDVCAHILKNAVKLLPGLESVAMSHRNSCAYDNYPGCEGPHDQWSPDHTSKRDLTDLVPTLLRFSALTLVHVEIYSLSGIQCLEECPNLKRFIGSPGCSLYHLLSKPWACCRTLEQLSIPIQLLGSIRYFSNDYDAAIICQSTVQSETYMINQLFHKIKQSSMPRLKKPDFHWGPRYSPWKLSLESALDLVNRDQDGKLVPLEETLNKEDLVDFLGLVWERDDNRIKARSEERRLIKEQNRPWEPLPGRGGQEFFPGFLDTGRKLRRQSYYCSRRPDGHWLDFPPGDRIEYGCCCAAYDTFDRYYDKIENFEEKIAAGPWFKDRKRLFKTGKSHCRLSPRQKLKQLW